MQHRRQADACGLHRGSRRVSVLARTTTSSRVTTTSSSSTGTTFTGLLAKVGTGFSTSALVRAEKQVLKLVQGAKGRALVGEALKQLTAAVDVLEANGGLLDPTDDPQLSGTWRLLFTSRPGSASPIQRAFTGVQSFTILQEVDLQGEEPRVNNVVRFGDVGQLKVQAQASTDNRLLEGFTPRQDAGDFLFGLFGRSFNYAPPRPNTRINFQFDSAAFTFRFLPFSLPYPVPFRLLGDERKGWIDVTYLSQDRSFRLSRGNKGTLFVLVKDEPLKAQLNKAIQEQDDEQVLALIDALQAANPTKAPARSPLAAGKWRLVWSQQAPTASALQKWGSAQGSTFQIIDGEDGTLVNLIDLGTLRIMAEATCKVASATRTNVFFSKAATSLGALTIPLPSPQNRRSVEEGQPGGFIDWLYLDEDLRVTRGSKGSLFVHTREPDV